MKKYSYQVIIYENSGFPLTDNQENILLVVLTITGNRETYSTYVKTVTISLLVMTY